MQHKTFHAVHYELGLISRTYVIFLVIVLLLTRTVRNDDKIPTMYASRAVDLGPLTYDGGALRESNTCREWKVAMTVN